MGPSLGCAVQEEDDYSKGERWEVYMLTLIFVWSSLFCKQRPKGLCLFNTTLKHKVEAYADDVNLSLPRKESTIREVLAVLKKFEKVSVQA